MNSYSEHQTTSSDEQYRIRKQIEGNNGMSYMNSMDERIDNGFDAGANKQELYFKDNKLRKIYNDGSYMDLDARKAYLTLDTRSKSNSKEKKGRYGAGEQNSRRLGGQGKVITTTTRDAGDTYQCIIDMHHLAYECETPQCWTGNHEKRPIFKKINKDKEYQSGTTVEYIGDRLKQHFELHEVVKHTANKYNKEIKSGKRIIIDWDNKKYEIPDIYNDDEDDVKRIKYECRYNIKEKSCMIKSDTGYFRKQKKWSKSTPNYHNDWVNDDECNKCYIYIYNPVIDSYSGKYSRSDLVNDRCKKLFKNMDITENSITIKCGENDILYNLEEFDGDQKKFDNSVLALDDDFISKLRISMCDFTLTTKPYRSYKEEALSSQTKGDSYDKCLIVEIDITKWETNNTNSISLENKDEVKIPKEMEEMIKKVISISNKNIYTYINKKQQPSPPPKQKQQQPVPTKQEQQPAPPQPVPPKQEQPRVESEDNEEEISRNRELTRVNSYTRGDWTIKEIKEQMNKFINKKDNNINQESLNKLGRLLDKLNNNINP